MPSETAAKFVAQISEWANQRPAARAAMRTGLGRSPAHCPEIMHAYLTRWIPEGTHPDREAAYFTVASLIAHAPQGSIPEETPGSLGSSLAMSEQSDTTTERVLHLLTRQSSATICRYLVNAVMPLRTARVPVDFAQLLDDLTNWPWQRKTIAKQWLQAYYRREALNETSA